MYVIYPLICYNAAHALDSSANLTKFLCNRMINPSTFQLLIRSTKAVVIALHAILSLARVLAQLRAFSAPMLVYSELTGHSNVCLGKEWYRFPSSFFIPENSEAMFVKSSFDGLLPGRFPAAGNLGERSGTWQIPTGMNDRNIKEASHLVTCLLVIT